ncbi:MAG TPA: hypothetical protein VIK02_05735 [Candidatus Anoxymicrobiaceae bacterium]
MTSAKERSLAQKLGLKPGVHAFAVRAPGSYLRTIGGATEDIRVIDAGSGIAGCAWTRRGRH